MLKDAMILRGALNRRSLLRGAVASVFCGTVPLLVSPALSQVSPMDLVPTFQAASTTLSLLQGFLGGGSALEFAISTQMIYLKEIVQKLDDIQVQLLSITDQISRLERSIKKEFDDAFRTQLIISIAGSAGSYTTLLDAYSKDSSTFSTQSAQVIMTQIYHDVEHPRTQLEAIPTGIGPEAAMIAPLALMLELACLAKMTTTPAPPSFIAATLDSYDAWLTRMLGDEPHSIAAYRAAAIDQHETAIADGSKTKDGIISGLANFSLSGTQNGLLFADPCIFLASPDIKTELPQAMTRNGDIAFTASQYAYLNFVDIAAEDDEALGVVVLKYPADEKLSISTPYPSKVVIGDTSMRGSDVSPKRGNLCFLQQERRYPHTLMSSQEVIDEVHKQGGRLTDAESYRNNLAQFVISANEARAKIGFSLKATALAQQTRVELQKLHKVIGL